MIKYPKVSIKIDAEVIDDEENTADWDLNIVIEFKQGEAVDALKEEALQQILDNQYYSGLHGDTLCIGIAHDKKKCSISHKYVN